MREVTLRVPDQSFDFFIELSKQLGFEAVEETAIPKSHQEIVKGRIRSAQPEQMSSWKEARQRFTFKA